MTFQRLQYRLRHLRRRHPGSDAWAWCGNQGFQAALRRVLVLKRYRQRLSMAGEKKDQFIDPECPLGKLAMLSSLYTDVRSILMVLLVFQRPADHSAVAGTVLLEFNLDAVDLVAPAEAFPEHERLLAVVSVVRECVVRECCARVLCENVELLEFS